MQNKHMSFAHSSFSGHIYLNERRCFLFSCEAIIHHQHSDMSTSFSFNLSNCNNDYTGMVMFSLMFPVAHVGFACFISS